jgi:ankyrin repeat protein
MTRQQIIFRRIIVACTAALLLSLAGFTLGAPAKSDVADAVEKGDLKALQALLLKKTDVNAPQADGATAVQWAVYRADMQAADLLIKAGADVKLKNREGISPLYLASMYGNAQMIERLLKAGADVKERGPNGETTLMLAARNGNPNAIRVLLAAGAEVNAKETIRGTTALMWAAEEKHPAAVAALLEAKADVGAKSGGAGVPRPYMANRVNTNTTIQEYERRKRAQAAGRTYEEQLAVDGVAGRGRGANGGGGGGFGGGRGQGGGQAAQAGQAASAGGDQPAADAGAAAGQQAAAGGRGRGGRGGGQGGRGGRGQGRGGAAAAAAGGAPAAANGAADAQDDNQSDDDAVAVAGLVGSSGGGLTALIMASREGDLESAKLLLDAGAKINQTTNDGWTPLLTATNNRHYQLAKLLIDRGADVNLANAKGWTPLYLATDNRNIEGGDYPVPKPDIDHMEILKALLDHGANPNARVKDNTLTRTIFTMQWFFEPGATAFVRASQSGDTKLMKLLLEHGADPKIATDYGDTALTAAAGIGWVEGVTYEWSPQENVAAVKMLLDLGLDPNAANADGRTPLMGAAIKGRNEVIQLLVDRGANLETRDNGSRDTDKVGSKLGGMRWQAVDYADGLVRVGVQSAVNRPEAGALIRKLMKDRGMNPPPPNRVVDSICIVPICMDDATKKEQLK